MAVQFSILDTFVSFIEDQNEGEEKKSQQIFIENKDVDVGNVWLI